MKFNIKTILRILFVLSCANLQAINYNNTGQRPKDFLRDPQPPPIDYNSLTAPNFYADNSTNSPEKSEPNTNPMPNQENQ